MAYIVTVHGKPSEALESGQTRYQVEKILERHGAKLIGPLPRFGRSKIICRLVGLDSFVISHV